MSAVEVKSGRNTKAKSLHQIYSVEKKVGRAVKLSEDNVFRDLNGIENYPLYALSFFPEALGPMTDGADIGEMTGMIDSVSGSGRSADFHPDEIKHLFGRYPADHHVLRHRFRGFLGHSHRTPASG